MGVSDDLKIVSGEVMPADLREKLKALVEEMRERAGSPAENRYVRLNLYWYADQLAALLAESEPERPSPAPSGSTALTRASPAISGATYCALPVGSHGGVSSPAGNARKTMCSRGHSLVSGEHVKIDTSEGRTRRRCLLCRKITNAAYAKTRVRASRAKREAH